MCIVTHARSTHAAGVGGRRRSRFHAAVPLPVHGSSSSSQSSSCVNAVGSPFPDPRWRGKARLVPPVPPCPRAPSPQPPLLLTPAVGHLLFFASSTSQGLFRWVGRRVSASWDLQSPLSPAQSPPVQWEERHHPADGSERKPRGKGFYSLGQKSVLRPLAGPSVVLSLALRRSVSVQCRIGQVTPFLAKSTRAREITCVSGNLIQDR